jgi:lysozyme
MGYTAAVKRAAILAVLLAPGLFFMFRFSQMPNRSRYPVLGVDVSHHQGLVDWPAVKKDGVSFAYLKASEGGDHRDGRFQENWRAAREAGLAAGAYHFYTFCRPGAAQADNFLGALRKAPGLELPPAVDLEFVGNCAKRPTKEELTRELADFTERVRSTTGRAPLFYVTGGYLRAYRETLPAGAAVWIRSVFASPRWTYGNDWVFWQFSGRGKVTGIKGPADLDVFRGSREEWEAFLRAPGAR